MRLVVIVIWSGSVLGFAIAWILGEIPFAWVFYAVMIGSLFYLPFSWGRGGGDGGGWSSGDGGMAVMEASKTRTGLALVTEQHRSRG